MASCRFCWLPVLLLLVCAVREAGSVVRVNLSRRSRPPAYRDYLVQHRRAQSSNNPYVIPLTNAQDIEYYGDVLIGTPDQKMSMMFDTGSSDLWVPDQHCNTPGCSTHTLFNTAQSTTYTPLGLSFSDSYGSGTVSGVQAEDTVTLAGFAVTGVRMGMVESEQAAFTQFLNDGLLGMAFVGLSSVTRPTTFALFAQQSGLPDMFSVYLSPSPSSPIQSQLLLGGVDMALATEGNATWHYSTVVPLQLDSGPIEYAYWLIEMGAMEMQPPATPSVSVSPSTPTPPATAASDGPTGAAAAAEAAGASTAVQLCPQTVSGQAACLAIVDTGTSLLGVPSALWPTFVSTIKDSNPSCALSSAGSLTCSNADLSLFPRLSFGLTPNTIYLSPAAYVSVAGSVASVMAMQLGSSIDIGGVSTWILGDTFLKNYYTLFDRANHRVGFACSSCTGTGTGTGTGGSGSSGGSGGSGGSGTASGGGGFAQWLASVNWQLVGFVGASVLITLTLALCCVQCCRRKQPAQRRRQRRQQWQRQQRQRSLLRRSNSSSTFPSDHYRQFMAAAGSSDGAATAAASSAAVGVRMLDEEAAAVAAEGGEEENHTRYAALSAAPPQPLPRGAAPMLPHGREAIEV